MKVINASVQEIKQGSGIKAIYQHIEKCGRTCYKSEDKITEDSAMKFFQGLVKRKHFAMLEHGTVYLRIPYFLINDKSMDTAIHKIRYSKYSFTIFDYTDSRGTILYITTNMRVLVEQVPRDILDYILRNFALEEPSTKHIKRLTAKFTISRGIANEFVRHRVFSFAQESTRYCNYLNDKFGGELTFIRPEWLKGEGIDREAKDVWLKAMDRSEKDYLHLIKLGVKPQNARGVLPLDLKTELIMTGTLDQWEAFWDLRMREITGPAHPDAKAIAEEWYAEEWYRIVNP